MEKTGTGKILEKYIRREMSQVELAELMDVSPQYISNIINNLKRPSEKFLCKFYNIFEVSDEDKRRIEEYEEYRKLPEKIKKELIDYRNGKKAQNTERYFNTVEIMLKGEITESEEILIYNEKKFMLFPNFDVNFESESDLFGLVLKNEKYFPEFQKGDILLFERHTQKNLEFFHKKECLIEYKMKKSIKIAEYINGILIFKSYDRQKESLVFSKIMFDIKIMGILKGCFRKFL